VEEQQTLADADAEGEGQQPRRLQRPRDGRMIAGVAAGIAEHLRIDVTLVRVLFVLAALLNLLGVLVYGLLWILVPADDAGEPGTPGARGGEPAPDLARAARGAGFWVGVSLVALGALWLLPLTTRGWFPGGLGIGDGLLLPLLLIGGGLALWLSEDRRVVAPASGDTTSPRHPPVEAPRPGAAPPTSPPPPPAPEHSGDGRTPPPPPSRERSPLVRLTLGLALLVAGALWLAGPAGLTTIRPAVVLSAALAVVGLGLLVGSVWGRGRLLILAGVPLSLVVVVAMLSPVLVPPVPFTGTVGQARVVVEDADGLQATYEHAAGQLHLDLRGLELEEDVATRISVGAGEVQVRLPDDLPVEVDASATVGELAVLDVRRSGIGPSLQLRDGSGDATLSLEVRLGAGELTVTRGRLPDDGHGFWGPRRPEPPGAAAWPARFHETIREVGR
jgi:phage shock protein PspC (stress-responsive transcriptional regulator)